MLSLLAVLAILPIGLNRTPLWAAYFAFVLFFLAYLAARRPEVVRQGLHVSRAVALPLGIGVVWFLYQLLYLLPLGPELTCALGDPRCAGGFLANVRFVMPASQTVAPWATQNHLLLYAGHLALFAVAFAVTGRRSVRARFYFWLMLFAVAQAVLAWGQWALTPGEEKAFGSTGTLLNPNHFGSLMLFFLALSAVVPLLPKGLHGAPVWMIGVAEFLSRWKIALQALFLSAAVLSFSRGAWVAGMFVAGLWLLYFVNGRRFLLPMIGLVIAGLASVGALVWALSVNAGSLLATDRFILWSSIYDAALHAGVMGFGPGSFEYVYPYFKPLTLPPLVYDHAHSDYLEVLFEQGWVGLVLMVSLVVSALFMSVRLASQAKGTARVALHTAIFGVGIVLLHGFIDFPLDIPGVNALMVLVVAVAVRGALESRHD